MNTKITFAIRSATCQTYNLKPVRRAIEARYGKPSPLPRKVVKAPKAFNQEPPVLRVHTSKRYALMSPLAAAASMVIIAMGTLGLLMVGA